MIETTSTTMKFTEDEKFYALESNFGVDAEYYEQDGQTFAIQFTEMDPGHLMSEAFPITRNEITGKLTSSGTPVNEFDWDSAEKFRGSDFPS